MIELKKKKKPSRDAYTDPVDAAGEPCLDQDSLSSFLHIWDMNYIIQLGSSLEARFHFL